MVEVPVRTVEEFVDLFFLLLRFPRKQLEEQFHVLEQYLHGLVLVLVQFCI